ncbi:MAG: prepilin-type N-terminal cleavage/methylation domain-containing protein [bacterium]|nr:prepilin-type N-terminal cleavage/methylation domain-containing protein [bacterium]
MRKNNLNSVLFRRFSVKNQLSHVKCPSRGFSLVEMIIYVGLLALILVSLVNMLLGMSRAYGYLKFSQHIQTSAVIALDRMVRDIRNAESVSVPESVLDTSPGILTLNTTTATSSLQTLQFFVSNGALRVKQDGGDLGPLTLPDVTVDNLVFRQMNTGISEAVKIDLTLSSGTHTANFYATALLRDSY